MLRKDVKLGFAIGGIMLAVVIVYVLVVPSGDKKSVGVVTEEPGTSKQDGTTPASPDASKTADGEEVADSKNAPPPVPSPTDLSQPPTTAPAPPSGGGPLASAGNNPTHSNGPDWNKLLSEGSSSPAMMSETPTVGGTNPADGSEASTANPDSAPTAKSRAYKPLDQATADSSSATAGGTATPDLSMDTSSDKESSSTTQPASGQRIHVVQSGEMLTSIAAAVYGDSHKWKKIAAANPNVNPNRLAVGTKLIIPALKASAESRATLADSTSAGGDAAGANIDPKKEYQVQPNDSLYRISIKLYGKADHVDKLYDANKDVIGSDPKRLKLNTILKLTDPPTTGA